MGLISPVELAALPLRSIYWISTFSLLEDSAVNNVSIFRSLEIECFASNTY